MLACQRCVANVCQQVGNGCGHGWHDQVFSGHGPQGNTHKALLNFALPLLLHQVTCMKVAESAASESRRRWLAMVYDEVRARVHPSAALHLCGIVGVPPLVATKIVPE